MVTFTRLTNQRLRTNRQEHLQTGKECACLSRCNHAASSLLPSCLLLLSFLFFSVLFFSVPLLLFLSACTFLRFPSVHMAHAYSSDHVRVAPDRSRSRDEPMWQNRNRQRRRQHRDTWHDVPPVRHPRRVLIIVNLEAVRPLMTAVHDDAMHGFNSMRILTFSWQNGRTCSVHLPSPDPSISRGNPHGEQFAVLHQPTHPVHLGSSS